MGTSELDGSGRARSGLDRARALGATRQTFVEPSDDVRVMRQVAWPGLTRPLDELVVAPSGLWIVVHRPWHDIAVARGRVITADADVTTEVQHLDQVRVQIARDLGITQGEAHALVVVPEEVPALRLEGVVIVGERIVRQVIISPGRRLTDAQLDVLARRTATVLEHGAPPPRVSVVPPNPYSDGNEAVWGAPKPAPAKPGPAKPAQGTPAAAAPAQGKPAPAPRPPGARPAARPAAARPAPARPAGRPAPTEPVPHTPQILPASDYLVPGAGYDEPPPPLPTPEELGLPPALVEPAQRVRPQADPIWPIAPPPGVWVEPEPEPELAQLVAGGPAEIHDEVPGWRPDRPGGRARVVDPGWPEVEEEPADQRTRVVQSAWPEVDDDDSDMGRTRVVNFPLQPLVTPGSGIRKPGLWSDGDEITEEAVAAFERDWADLSAADADETDAEPTPQARSARAVADAKPAPPARSTRAVAAEEKPAPTGADADRPLGGLFSPGSEPDDVPDDEPGPGREARSRLPIAWDQDPSQPAGRARPEVDWDPPAPRRDRLPVAWDEPAVDPDPLAPFAAQAREEPHPDLPAERPGRYTRPDRATPGKAGGEPRVGRFGPVEADGPDELPFSQYYEPVDVLAPVASASLVTDELPFDQYYDPVVASTDTPDDEQYEDPYDDKPYEDRYDDKAYEQDQLDDKPYEQDQFDDKPYEQDQFDDKPYEQDEYDDKAYEQDRYDDKPYDEHQYDDKPYEQDEYDDDELWQDEPGPEPGSPFDSYDDGPVATTRARGWAGPERFDDDLPEPDLPDDELDPQVATGRYSADGPTVRSERYIRPDRAPARLAPLSRPPAGVRPARARRPAPTRSGAGDAGPWDLTPGQSAAISTCFPGPARVRGAFGTGRSVVAVSRAVHLAQTRPGVVALIVPSPAQVEPTRRRLALVATDDELDRIVVDVPAGVAQAVLHEFGTEVNPAPESVARAWAAAQRTTGLGAAQGRSIALVCDEVGLIRGRSLISEGGYHRLRQEVPGGLRHQVWVLHEAYVAELRRQNVPDEHDMVRMARAALRAGVPSQFTSAVVDDANDLTVDQLAMLRETVGTGEDALTIIDDGLPGLAPVGATLGEAGIDVGQRQLELTHEFRLTGPAWTSLVRLLQPDTGRDIAGTTDRPRLSGAMDDGEGPAYLRSQAIRVRREMLVERVVELIADGVDPGAIALLHIEEEPEPDLVAELVRAGVLPRGLDALDVSGVALGRARDARGVEFDHVLVPDARHRDVVPVGGLRWDQRQRRRLLGLALSRSRETAWIAGL